MKVKFLRKYKNYKIGEFGEFEGEELKFVLERKIGIETQEVIKNSKPSDENLIKELEDLKLQLEGKDKELEDLKLQLEGKDKELEDLKSQLEKLKKKDK